MRYLTANQPIGRRTLYFLYYINTNTLETRFCVNVNEKLFLISFRYFLLLLQAYKEDTRQNGEEESLPGVNLNNDQAFFVAFAQVRNSPLKMLLFVSRLLVDMVNEKVK